MADPQIRQQTASEPLNIEEEYDMQRSWHQDNDSEWRGSDVGVQPLSARIASLCILTLVILLLLRRHLCRADVHYTGTPSHVEPARAVFLGHRGHRGHGHGWRRQHVPFRAP